MTISSRARALPSVPQVDLLNSMSVAPSARVSFLRLEHPCNSDDLRAFAPPGISTSSRAVSNSSILAGMVVICDEK